MSGDEAAGSPQLSLSGYSSLFSLDVPLPSLSLGVGADGEEERDEEDQVVSSGQGTTAHVRRMKNRESALRSRARKRAYVQELEKEVRRLVDDNLKLKRQCKQLKTEMAAHSSSCNQPAVGRSAVHTELPPPLSSSLLNLQATAFVFH